MVSTGNFTEKWRLVYHYSMLAQFTCFSYSSWPRAEWLTTLHCGPCSLWLLVSKGKIEAQRKVMWWFGGVTGT